MKKSFLTILLASILPFMGGCFDTSNLYAQWPSDDYSGIKVIPDGLTNYDADITVDVMGNSWHWFYRPTGDGLYDIVLQSISPEGVQRFGEDGIVMAETKNISFTMCNQTMLACSDSTVMVFLEDMREDIGMSYTVYRLDKDGNHLWGEEGVHISHANEEEMPCQISAVELPNGNVICVWQDYNSEKSHFCLGQQILTPKGEKLLGDDPLFYNEKVDCWWPVVVSDEQGGYFVCFGRGQNYYLAVQKFNDKGESQWDSAVILSKKSSWNGMPMWCMSDVQPSGDGGIIVGWYDSRDDGYLHPYMSYIKADGTSGFITSTGSYDALLSYNGYTVTDISILPDPAGRGFLALYIESPQSGIKNATLQLISKDGELLYGTEGRPLMDLQYQDLAYVSLQKCDDKSVTAVWMHNEYSANCTTTIMAERFDTEKAEPVWEDSIRVFLDGAHDCGSFQMQKAADHYVMRWHDAGNYDEGFFYDGKQRQYAQRLNFDGTVGNPAPSGIKGIGDNTSHLSPLTTNLYNLQGQRVTTPQRGSIYIKGGRKFIKD